MELCSLGSIGYYASHYDWIVCDIEAIHSAKVKISYSRGQFWMTKVEQLRSDSLVEEFRREETVRNV
ncbi:hypothetical protein N7490_008263 [Penicillium lividum]|nr:hypothetical protein N7490_008263 [Penicillium lividum]